MTAINHITEDNLNNFRNKSWMDKYQSIATQSAFYPGQGTPLGLVYVALKLNVEAGEFIEHVGKAMRDDNLLTADNQGSTYFGVLTPERKTLLIKEIGDVLWYLSAACNELEINLSDAAMQNLVKLKDRNTLRGSGDNR